MLPLSAPGISSAQITVVCSPGCVGTVSPSCRCGLVCCPNPKTLPMGPAAGIGGRCTRSYAPMGPGIWVFVYPILFPRPGCWPGPACDGAVDMLPMDAAFSSMTNSHGSLTASSTGRKHTCMSFRLAVRPQAPAPGFWQEPAHHGTEPDTLGICDQFDARRAWPVDAPVEAPSYPYWVLAPGSMAVSRRWPVEWFAALAQHIARTTGLWLW